MRPTVFHPVASTTSLTTPANTATWKPRSNQLQVFMDQTLKAILGILEEGTPELKIAACQVLGELRPRDSAASRALAQRLSAQEPFLTTFVLEALAQIGTTESVRALVSKLGVAGAVGERVAHLLGQMGPQVTKALAPMFDEGDDEMKEQVLVILGRHTDRAALTILKKALLHADPSLSEKASTVIAGHLEDLDDKAREFLQQGLEKSLSAKAAAGLLPATIARVLPLLSHMDGPGSRTLLLRYAQAKQPPVVRQAALQALDGVELTPAQQRTVLGYVAEEDMTHVVRPAMILLKDVGQWTAASANALQKMMESRSEERRLFGLRALRNRKTEKMAKSCIKWLLSGRLEFQEAASEALRDNKAGLGSLLRAFQLEKNIDRARLLAGSLAGLGEHLQPAQRKALIEKASKLITAGEPMSEVYLSLLFDIDVELATKDLIQKGVRLRRARKLEDSLTILMRLAQSEHIDDEGRYQLALARLMLDGQTRRPNGATESREAGDATMGYFAVLIREGFPVFDRLRKEGQLTPNDLFHVGRHFAAGVAGERRLGGDLLNHIATKHARRKVGEEAKLMLRSEGLLASS